MSYQEKYIKYKNKYLELKSQIGGQRAIVPPTNQYSRDTNKFSRSPILPLPAPNILPPPTPAPLIDPALPPLTTPTPSPLTTPTLAPNPIQATVPLTDPALAPIIHVPPDTLNTNETSCLIRNKSTYHSIQEGGTCYIHVIARLISRLLKMCITFNDIKKECDDYYNMTICSNIFDCFSINQCPDLEKNEDQLADYLSVLLFHFIYLKIFNLTNSCNGGWSEIGSLYILDFIKYAEINSDTIKTVLNYNETSYDDEDKEYFNKLINELLKFLNKVKQEFKNGNFNPEFYTLDSGLKKSYNNFLLLNNFSYKNVNGEELIASKQTINSSHFGQIIQNYHLYKLNYLFTHKYPFDNNMTSLEILKTILNGGFYALLQIDKHVVIITHISNNKLVIKNTWGKSKRAKTKEKKWCPIIDDNSQIDYNQLIKSYLNYEISFFYNVPKYIVPCFIHTATTLVTQLLKLLAPEMFSNVNQQCDFYYNLRTCNDEDRSIFDYFLDKHDCIKDIGKNIKKEHLLALLFHFIFLKINETFEKNCKNGNSIVASLYILDYIKYAKISREKIIELLRYEETKYINYNIFREHFNQVIDSLLVFLNNVKQNLNLKLYYLDNKNDKFKLQDPVYYYDSLDNKFVPTPDNIENPKLNSNLVNMNDRPIIFTPASIFEGLGQFGKQKLYETEFFYQFLTNDKSFDIPQLTTLKKILGMGYYAFLIKNPKKYLIETIIITNIDDEDNLVIKNPWENKCVKSQSLLFPGLINGCKIKFDDLKKSTYDYTINFFILSKDLE